MLKEFKEFLARGNVIDLAIALIMGAAFGKIIAALVEKILMPIIGMFMGGVDFSSLAVTVGSGDKPAVLQYGAFIMAIIEFVIIAFALFMIIKAYNKAQKPVEEEATGPSQEELLSEIRDLLKR